MIQRRLASGEVHRHLHKREMSQQPRQLMRSHAVGVEHDGNPWLRAIERRLQKIHAPQRIASAERDGMKRRALELALNLANQCRRHIHRRRLRLTGEAHE